MVHRPGSNINTKAIVILLHSVLQLLINFLTNAAFRVRGSFMKCFMWNNYAELKSTFNKLIKFEILSSLNTCHWVFMFVIHNHTWKYVISLTTTSIGLTFSVQCFWAFLPWWQINWQILVLFLIFALRDYNKVHGTHEPPRSHKE